MESLIFLLLLSMPLVDPSSHDYFNTAIGTSDGGTALGGSLHRNEAVVVKLSANGTHEWTTIFPGKGEVSSIAETPDDYVLTGFYPFVSIHKTRGFAFIAKLDKKGKVQWQRDIEHGGYNDLHKIILTQDGGYVAVGMITNGGSENGFVIKFDANGEDVWYRLLEAESTDVFTDIKETASNEFMIFGKSDDRPMIVTVVEKEDQVDMVNLFFLVLRSL